MNQESTKINIQQDMRDARALLEQVGGDEERKKYRKAAEIILLKAIRLEPENEEAKILLQSVRGVPAASLSTLPQPQQPPQLPQSDDPSFTAPRARSLFTALGENKKLRSKVLAGLIVTLLVITGGIIWIGQTHGMSSSAAYSAVPRTPNVQQTALPVAVPDTPPAAQQQADAPATPAAQTQQPVHTPEAAPAAEAAAPSPKAPTPAMGKLAVTSSTRAEIYQGDKRLGSTPMTIQLAAGKQTLEYRLGDLRTVISHDIKADKTTNATVTFQATIQINAKPWAQVFIDGTQRRALGQTPLSGVSVPVGSVLVFENPNFASKTHRVTEKDTAIQMDFQ